MTLAALAPQIADLARQCYARGWMLGTSGNISSVLQRDPLRLAITASGVHKGVLTPADILEIDRHGKAVGGSGRPSAEASLHLAVARSRGAGAVLHTHSIWSTLISEAATGDGLAIEGYEMLKGLAGVATHDHREWLPIVENTQDWAAAAPKVEELLARHPDAHGFLVRRHGLYTWGRDLDEARRHVETLEFLFEVIGRKRGSAWQQ
jgi:methylthioribulose-1-phosphate dehydratase